jgi:hypothetical protein
MDVRIARVDSEVSLFVDMGWRQNALTSIPEQQQQGNQHDGLTQSG